MKSTMYLSWNLLVGFCCSRYSVAESDMGGFYKVNLVLPMLFCTIFCKNIDR